MRLLAEMLGSGTIMLDACLNLLEVGFTLTHSTGFNWTHFNVSDKTLHRTFCEELAIMYLVSSSQRVYLDGW